ncbi:MAG: hypothetical protein ACK2U9_13610 [Anaerolineae bacterium]
MTRTEIIDTLAVHADQLLRSGVPPRPRTARHDQIQGLLDLAEQVQGILVPVEPDANFRRRLHGELILEAQRRATEPEVGLLQQHRTGIIIGAAAIGSVASVVGVIIAFVLRWRHGRATHIATG